jgi:two-component system, OmpR family, phosphate regulon sensor histidine kinase PhoR
LDQVTTLNTELEERVVHRTQDLQAAQDRDRANLRRLQSMLSHLPLAALMMDEKSNIIELNERYCEIFHIGVSAQEAMRLPKEDLNARFKRCLLNEETHMKEVMSTIEARKEKLGHDILLSDGRIIQRDFLPIYDDEKFRGQLFLYRDVTKERRVDASKSEFMSLASHQLRTPLTAIRWSLGRLQKNLSGQIARLEDQLLTDSVVAAGRMSETINTMLQISRLQADQVVVNSTEIKLHPYLHEIAHTVEAECALKQLKLTVECPEDLALKTDPQLLIEVLSNLLSNACKYTPEHGTLRLCAFPSGHTIELIVQDSGYGIPLHQQQSVFKKFFRGDNVVSKDPDGTGLGLYLVSLIVRLLDGSIRFESREGRGTTFTVVLPAR